jgi:hypothetical protein
MYTYTCLLNANQTHIFYVVIREHFTGKCVINPWSAEYTHRELVLIYWSYCALCSVVLVAATMQAL